MRLSLQKSPPSPIPPVAQSVIFSNPLPCHPGRELNRKDTQNRLRLTGLPSSYTSILWVVCVEVGVHVNGCLSTRSAIKPPIPDQIGANLTELASRSCDTEPLNLDSAFTSSSHGHSHSSNGPPVMPGLPSQHNPPSRYAKAVQPREAP